MCPPNPTSHADDQHVTILLASYMGAAYLQGQLDSIAAQTNRNWSLIISDDGSTDATREIAAGFARTLPAGQVRCVEGPREGAAQNFMSLLEIAPDDSALAFCDQDDVWKPEKLSRAVAALASHAGPAHYAARTIICNDRLQDLTESRQFNRPFGFRNALVQACMAGNTSVFNRSAARILKAGVSPARRAGIEAHDWWAYQLTAGAGATLIHDAHPTLLYRQHGRSEMGRNDTVSAMVKRLAKLFAGNFGGWLAANHRALAEVSDLLTDENREILPQFGAALAASGPETARIFRRLGLYRHTRTGTMALYGAAAMGRLRQPR